MLRIFALYSRSHNFAKDIFIRSSDEYVAKIAEKYNATIPQICVRYCIQKGAVAIPKSTKEERIISNVQVDFEISDEDMAYLDKK
ncbi:aldo/keto reductase [Helicobacter typhlonius]|uniref:aldo/keto reductase n=1 Tax=Helicobacter typhlonius TaxID=76936 RepID=UPI003A5C7DFC